jgi:hypothetical protein
MHADDLILISVDDHVIEPPGMFDGRLPAKYAEKAPRFIGRADGTMAWVYEGIETPNTAVALRRPAAGWDVTVQATTHLRPAV